MRCLPCAWMLEKEHQYRRSVALPAQRKYRQVSLKGEDLARILNFEF